MQSISYATAKEYKLIRFMTPRALMDTEEAFSIKNDDRLRITSGYNDSQSKK